MHSASVHGAALGHCVDSQWQHLECSSGGGDGAQSVSHLLTGVAESSQPRVAADPHQSPAHYPLSEYNAAHALLGQKVSETGTHTTVSKVSLIDNR